MPDKTIEERIIELRDLVKSSPYKPEYKPEAEQPEEYTPEKKRLVGKVLKYYAPLAAAGIAAFVGADYLTGNYVTKTFNVAGYPAFALYGAAMGVCGELMGFMIARMVTDRKSSGIKLSKKGLYANELIGAVAGGAASAIACHFNGPVQFGAGLVAAMSVGFIAGYATKNRKPVQKKNAR